MLGKNIELAHDHWQLTVARGVEDESDLVVAGFLNLRYVAIVGGKLRAVLFERRKGKDNVLGCNRLAVVPASLRPQSIGRRREIVGVADGFGDKTVLGGHFVKRRHQQRVIEKEDAGGEAALDAVHHYIEVVKGADRDLAYRAALRRLRVDVFEVFETGRILHITEQRKAVAPVRRVRTRRARPGG